MKWRSIFIFLTGFMLHEVLTHAWLDLEGLLPLTSKLFFGLTITSGLNTLILFIDILLLMICAWLAFLHDWRPKVHSERIA